MFKVDNKDTRTTSIKHTKAKLQLKVGCFSMYDLRRSGVFINIFYSTPFSCVSIVNFEQVNVFRVATTNASLKTNN